MSLIEFRNITKVFGTFTACNDISISIEESHIHAIIGENGAGKSTLVKMLGGIESITSGQIILNNQIYTPASAQDAFKNKIAFIHQHFVLAENLSALDNLVLSYSSHRFSLTPQGRTQVLEKAEQLLQRFNWQINLQCVVNQLSVGEQQRLEILKALMQEPDIIIFDEPTAVLTPQESEDLLKFIQQLKDENKTIVVISHKLNEIKTIADEISILRHGQHIATKKNNDLTIEKMAELMIGRQIIKNNSVKRPTEKQNLLQLPNTQINLYKSEIFGVAGIEGNGQNQLIANLLGEFKKHSLIYGDITEDRLKLSVFGELNLTEHMLLKHHELFSKNGFIKNKKLQFETQKLIEEWDVRPNDIKKPLADFSGGNQQKFIVGRELFNNPDVLLAAHPTRGVDLGAQEKIHNDLINYSQKEKCVVLVSSDLNEVLFLSDRFIILNKNKIFGPFNKNELSEQQIGLYMTAKVQNEPAATRHV